MAHKQGTELQFPVKTRKKPRTIEKKTILIIRDENKYTVSLIINYMMNVRTASFPVLLALGFIISIPTLLIYALFQKYLTYGIDFSGVKG